MNTYYIKNAYIDEYGIAGLICKAKSKKEAHRKFLMHTNKYPERELVIIYEKIKILKKNKIVEISYCE